MGDYQQAFVPKPYCEAPRLLWRKIPPDSASGGESQIEEEVTGSVYLTDFPYFAIEHLLWFMQPVEAGCD